MEWANGFSSRYYATFINPNTWADIEEFQIFEGSISRKDENLQESASISVTEYNQTNERWIRIWLDARQESDSARIPLFTGIASSPKKEYDGTYVKNSLQCYSVLKPIEDILLRRGWFAPEGANSGKVVSQLMEGTPAPFEIDGNPPELSSNIIAEDGETNLSMVENILKIIGWRLKISGDGKIVMTQAAEKYSAYFNPNENDVIETQLSVDNDWFSCPNVFRAISGDSTVIARDDSENSPLSTINRGREIWMEEQNASLYYGETLEHYAERRLKEEQQTVFSISYKRRFYPDITTSDLVRLHYPQQEIDGVFYIVSQNIELTHGATISEVVEKYE